MGLSENDREVEVGRHLRRSCGAGPPLRQGHPEPDAQDHVQIGCEDLQAWRLQNLSGQSVPGVDHPDGAKAFPDVQMEPSVFELVCIASCPVTEHH